MRYLWGTDQLGLSGALPFSGSVEVLGQTYPAYRLFIIAVGLVVFAVLYLLLGSRARETLRTLNRHFQLRTCTDHVLETRGRPCLQYQIKRCTAPCVDLISKEQYAKDVDAAIEFLEQGGKKVIISETGWPNIGTATGAAVPSWNNAIRYFLNTCQWAEEENIEIFYFSSFDESWKVGDEGDVGAYWGLWDEDGNLKYV